MVGFLAGLGIAAIGALIGIGGTIASDGLKIKDTEPHRFYLHDRDIHRFDGKFKFEFGEFNIRDRDPHVIVDRDPHVISVDWLGLASVFKSKKSVVVIRSLSGTLFETYDLGTGFFTKRKNFEFFLQTKMNGIDVHEKLEWEFNTNSLKRTRNVVLDEKKENIILQNDAVGRFELVHYEKGELFQVRPCLETFSHCSSDVRLKGNGVRVEGYGVCQFQTAIPVLVSENDKNYTVKCSSEHAGVPEFPRMFACFIPFSNQRGYWATADYQIRDSFIDLKLPKPENFNVLVLGNYPQDGGVDSSPTMFDIQGSNDGQNYKPITELSIEWSHLGEEHYLFFENELHFRYYRLKFFTTVSSSKYPFLSLFRVNYGNVL